MNCCSTYRIHAYRALCYAVVHIVFKLSVPSLTLALYGSIPGIHTIRVLRCTGVRIVCVHSDIVATLVIIQYVFIN